MEILLDRFGEALFCFLLIRCLRQNTCSLHEWYLTEAEPRVTLESVPTEKELLERIRQLEEQNSALQDKLDEIWSVLAPVYEPDDDLTDSDLIQIQGPKQTQ